MRRTNSKDKKKSKLHFWGSKGVKGVKGVKGGLKSRDPQKTHLAFLLNVNTKFQLSSSILRGDRG